MEPFDSPEQLMQREKLTAKLVFDTATSQHTAGSRRREANSRHLLFEVGDLCLDLRLDAVPQSDSAVLVGQLADRMDPLKPFAGLPGCIKLSRGRTIQARISDDGVLVGDQRAGRHRPHHDGATRQTLAYIVVSIAEHLQLDPLHRECAKRLARGTAQADRQVSRRQAIHAVLASDLR